MFLKRLEINGFKSFANKTSLDFSLKGEERRGVTAIVGPNGSGKSNIADSIRWVMGEQSMKNLRGKKSEDIIFAGSGKKARLGSASASLYFDNSTRRIPLDFSEVSITRKIFRSGESEFLINGSKVRLQDIVDLLAKAGIGRESYSIVTQGMADAVLNASPLERRVLIEEAAGVKQYQIKKERSLKKLDSTRENLRRAKELSEEIRPHLKMLKRQAEKAAQGEEVSKKLKEKQTAYFFGLWNNYKKEKEELSAKKEELGIRMMNVQREVDKLSDELKKEAQESRENLRVLELERQRSDASGKLNELEKNLVVSEGRIQIEKEKAKSLAMIESIKTESISVDISYIKKEFKEIQREQEELLRKIENAKSLEELEAIRSQALLIRKKMEELGVDMEKGRKETAKKEEAKAPLKIPVVDNKAVSELEEKSRNLRGEIEAQKGKIFQIEKDIIAEKEKDNERRRLFFEIEGSLRKKQFELDKFKDDFNDSKVALARVEVREEDLRNDARGALNMDPEDIKWEGDASGIDQFTLSSEINKLKIQMEQIGGIDPVVVEEYRETNERYEFLTREAEDLEKAIVSLKEVIREMDKKINESFETTFLEISKEFTKYFRIIFGGGNASLNKVKVEVRRSRSLEDETEAESGEEASGEEKEEKKNFENGIDIVACPPGKRISNLSMLSGGERSLTSLALLFSIISHNPPPFSVLDEVEAALDEANSKRFGRIIQELSNQTQFVIITHNRETMRQASLLYGVTMGEDGISKLLSVRLDQVGQGGKIKES